jgi:PAS domain S-box-containing protein
MRAKKSSRRNGKSQLWLSTMLKSIDEAIVAIYPRKRILFMNPSSEKLTGWNKEEAIGKKFTDVFKMTDEDSRRLVEFPLDGNLSRRTILTSRDRSEHPIEGAGTPLRNGKGKVTGFVLVFRDVSERRRSDAALKRIEERKAAVVETALDCIIVMDHLGRVVEFNPSAERTFGYRRSEVIGKLMADLIIPPALRERHRIGLARYLATGEGPVMNQRIELNAMRSDGTEFPVELAITRVPGETPPLFTGYLRDISERKLEQRAKEMELRVTSATGKARDLSEALSHCLEEVCRSESWHFGQAWFRDTQSETLLCAEQWYSTEARLEPFRELSLETRFPPGVGLPGLIWQTNHAQWIADFRARGYPRSAKAAELGIVTAAGFPIHFGGKIAAVMEFFSLSARPANPYLMRALERLGATLSGILERKRAEDVVRQAEEQLRLITDTVPALISYVDRNQRYVFTNQGYEEWFGKSSSQARGMHLRDLLGSEMYSIALPYVERALRGEQVTYEANMPYPQRGHRWTQISYVPHQGPQGRVEGFVVMVTDITDRKREEDAKEFLSESTKALSESLDYEQNLHHVARLAVPKIANWCAIHLLEDERIRCVARAPSAEGPSDAESRYKRVLESGRSEREPSSLCVPLIVAGQPVGAISMAITHPNRVFETRDSELAEELARRVAMSIDNAKLYRKAKEAVRARDEFLSIASHELRTPLTSQQLQLQGILRQVTKGHPEALSPDRMLRTLELIKRQGDRLTHLVSNLLDLSRINVGRLSLELTDTNLEDVLAAVLERLKEEIRRSGSTVNIRVDKNASGRWDALRIDQVVENLVTNALKYGNQKPIDVSVTSEDSSVALVVQDQGIGIDPSDQSRLFRPFERAASSRQYGGLGMGLFIVRQIVEAHGGSIQLKSAPGSGSAFTVRLPRLPPE